RHHVSIHTYPLTSFPTRRSSDLFQQSKDFFRPSSNQIHSPSLLKDMDLALSRIMRAIETEEKILIYGDYDVDGTTAVALLYQFRSEEHTSELQSRFDIVCRLLLE